LLVAAFVGRIEYQKHHIYSSYGNNPNGTISLDKAKIPKGWSQDSTISSNQVYLWDNPPYDVDAKVVGFIKVPDSSMKYTDASSLAMKLRNNKPRSLTNSGYKIIMKPGSSIVVTINSKKVRLPTVEYSEVYPYRLEDSYAYYVQNGYYISIERYSFTYFNSNPNHNKLLNSINVALPAISID
jgi:hypothetical protein